MIRQISTKIFTNLVILLLACCGLKQSDNHKTILLGHDQGNAGDTRSADDGAAWFLGSQTMRICVDREADFPISPDEVHSTLKTVVETWKSYFAEKIAGGPAEISYNDHKNRPTFEFSLMERCDQTEDLKLYLGSTDDTVANAKKFFENPTAFAKKTAYNDDLGWGKGFIWIAKSGPNFEWTGRPNLFLAIMLHEFGHVFGCEHADGTIMATNIVHMIQSGSVSDPNMAKPYLTQIDNNKELVLNPDAPISIDGFVNEKACQVFMGRPCQGSLRGTFKVESKQTKTLEIRDDLGHVDVVLKTESASSSFSSDSHMFKIYRTGDMNTDVFVAGSTAKVDYGDAVGANGASSDVVIERNSMSAEAGRIRILYRTPKGLQVLFGAFIYIF